MGEDEVEEAEWDNPPDEEYKDDDYMTKDIAGGLNGCQRQRCVTCKRSKVYPTKMLINISQSYVKT